jgi:hypothetical protein
MLKNGIPLALGLLLVALDAFAGAADSSSASGSTSLLEAFRKGKVSGRFRYYFMYTDHPGNLTDYYAHAAGGAIKFETGRLYHFQLGTGSSFTYNLASSDLAAPDPKTGQPNRYEIGLFDIQNPKNTSNLFRLEELYLKYNLSVGDITAGKQAINTPFINPQDGRMRPTFADGLLTHLHFGKTTIDGGWLYGISPRSTQRWYFIDQSIGLYPVGVNPDGTKSGYYGNVHSKGIALVNLTQQLTTAIKLSFSEQFVENMFNTALLQVNYEPKLSEKSKLLFAAQATRQDAVNDGGNADPAKTYFEKGGRSWVFSGRIGFKNPHWDASANYTRITADGSYLMPREWGRDHFFTFMPRERNEGAGDVHAVMGKVAYTFNIPGLRAELAAGHFEMPDVKNYRLNKYSQPAYNQYNIDLRYAMPGFLKGADVQLLYVYKQATGNTYGNDKYIFNRVNMSLVNLIVNYSF